MVWDRCPAMLCYAAWCSLVVFEVGVLNFLGQQLKFFILSVFQICSARSYLKAPASIMCSQFHIHSSLNMWQCRVQLGNTLDVELSSLVLTFKMMLNCTVIFCALCGFSSLCLYGAVVWFFVGWYGLGFSSGFCLLRVNWGGLGLCCLFWRGWFCAIS